MILGIVGSEARKFTPITEALARKAIRGGILSLKATKVCSGRCPLGGIDVWAVEEAIALLGPGSTIEFPPKKNRWGGNDGYKARNIKIAETSDVVICLTLKSYDMLPSTYVMKPWDGYCYHCGTDQHVKSGGCWSAKYARSLGKPGYTLAIE